jgi:hypothetical protein
MDMKKELAALNISDNFGADIIKQVILQEQELAKKFHILKVTSFANQIEAIVNTDLFIKDDIKFLEIIYEADDHNGATDILIFELIDKDGETVAGYYDAEDNRQAKIVHDIFEELHGTNLNLINPKLKKSDIRLELKPGIKENIMDALLNKNLKTIYDYNNIENIIEDSNKNTSKKLKI